MMKRIVKATFVLFAFLTLHSVSAVAQQDDGMWRKTIVVTTLDGTTMEYLIDVDTKVRIDKPNLVIETEGVVLNYELEKMAQMRYGKRFIPTGINGVAVEEQPFKWEDETVFFYCLPSNTLIEVFTTDGKLVVSRQCSGNFQLPLNTLTNGVYLVKVNDVTYKIVKR